jgi:hypothetical protein
VIAFRAHPEKQFRAGQQFVTLSKRYQQPATWVFTDQKFLQAENLLPRGELHNRERSVGFIRTSRNGFALLIMFPVIKTNPIHVLSQVSSGSRLRRRLPELLILENHYTGAPLWSVGLQARNPENYVPPAT